MEFPTSAQIIHQWFVLILMGPLFVLSGTIFILWSLFKWMRQGVLSPKHIIIGIGHAGMGLLLTIIGCYSIYNNTQYHLNLSRISEIAVQHLDEKTHKPTGKAVVFNDTDQLTTAFRSLPNLGGFSTNHESLTDGYLIRLKLSGESNYSDRFFRFYRKTTKNRQVAVIMPAIGTDFSSTSDTYGKYSCPEFNNWMIENIDPLFSDNSDKAETSTDSQSPKSK